MHEILRGGQDKNMMIFDERIIGLMYDSQKRFGMNRRIFIRQLLNGVGAYLAMKVNMDHAVMAGMPASPSTGELNYRPLNGLCLRNIAKKKLHHAGDGIFKNPMGVRNHRNLVQLLNWKLCQPNHFSKYLNEEPVKTVHINWNEIKQKKGVAITFLKHACVVIKDDDSLMAVDPLFNDITFFIKDFTPFAPESFIVPRMDHVLITHGHYDHLDKPTLASFPGDTHVISPLGYGDIFKSLQMNHTHALDWFDVHDDGKTEITCLPCNHWTMRNPLIGPNHSLWGAYLIRTKSGMTIFISGDTAYFDGFEQIGSEYDIDLAIFNLGAYEPRWFMAPSHMNPVEVVKAFQEIRAKKLMVVHWGTFRLGDEPVHFPPIQLKGELKKQGLLEHLIDVDHGETVFLS